MTELKAKRGGGRKARLAQRAAPPKINPAPPGAAGGRYQPLTEAEMTQIFDTALRLLSDLGMGEVPDRLADDLIRAGARAHGDRIRIPGDLVQAAIAATPKRFTLHGRAPGRDITLGGDAVHFGTGGAAVQTLDMDSGIYRPSTLQDLRDFTRLQDALDNVSWFTRCCIATDLPDLWELDANTAHALMAGTTKPTATAFTIAEHVAPLVEMFDIAAGGRAPLPRAPSSRPISRQ
ncbi:trimethylamine methyltransferase family protein [Roseobacteraceae bacterium S113]